MPQTELERLPTATLLTMAAELARSDEDWLTADRAAVLAAVYERQDRPSFETAAAWTTSDDSIEREVAAYVLARLGAPPETDAETTDSGEDDRAREPEWVDEIPALLWPLLDDTSRRVVIAALLALGEFDIDTDLLRLEPLLASTDAGIRLALAKAVGGSEDGPGFEMLVQLSNDKDSDVRNWATFALAQLCDRDDATLEGALRERLHDPNRDVRCEALYGLSRRGHRSILEQLEAELRSDQVPGLAVEAAGLLAAPELLPALLELRTWWDPAEHGLESAIDSCRGTRPPTTEPEA